MNCLLLGKGEKSGSIAGTSLTVETCSLLSGLTRGSELDFSGFLQQLVLASGGHVELSPGGGHTMGVSGSTTNNPSFNEVLFGKYKNLKVDGKLIKSRDIRNKINCAFQGGSKADMPDMAHKGHVQCRLSTGDRPCQLHQLQVSAHVWLV